MDHVSSFFFQISVPHPHTNPYSLSPSSFVVYLNTKATAKTNTGSQTQLDAGMLVSY